MMSRFYKEMSVTFKQPWTKEARGGGTRGALQPRTELAWTSFVLTYSLAGVSVICRTICTTQRGKFLTRMSCRSDCCNSDSRCLSLVPAWETSACVF